MHKLMAWRLMTTFNARLPVMHHLQDVDIIVFPEYGLAPGLLTLRRVIAPFLEEVPDPAVVAFNPCEMPRKYPQSFALRRLSCMARDYRLYLVANVGSKVYCEVGSGGCPDDGRFHYNTNVVFDPTGRLLVRTYKMHIFSTEYLTYDSPARGQPAVFDTSFGRFVTFICYDVLFHDASVTLIEDFAVDSVAFSTAWMNVLPHFSAVPFHAAFAAAAGVNFLSANLRHQPYRCDGSGIFTPKGSVAHRSDPQAAGSRLLIADLPVKAVRWRRQHTNISDDVRPGTQFRAAVFSDEYDFVELAGDGGRVAVCQGELCCHAEYSYSDKAHGELYALGAYAGVHNTDGDMYLQVCAVLKCGNASRDSCGAEVMRAQTRFAHVNVTGNFSTSYVFPMLVTGGGDPTPGEWAYDGRSIDTRAPKRPFVSAILLGRVYGWDPHPAPASHPPTYRPLLLVAAVGIISSLIICVKRPSLRKKKK